MIVVVDTNCVLINFRFIVLFQTLQNTKEILNFNQNLMIPSQMHGLSDVSGCYSEILVDVMNRVFHKHTELAILTSEVLL